MSNGSQYRLTCEFEYNTEKYIAYLCPYYELSDEELSKYHISNYSYVCHLFSLQGFRTFEMFPDENLHWGTNASSMLVDKEIVEIMGYVLVNAFR
ncbi:MAG: hypothetical protein H7Y42_00435 [Chitinophagaceae bacterium]|nr:hypothetical protein [Chitinophagaceae bacterium]